MKCAWQGMTGKLVISQPCPGRECQRNFTSASVVSLGFSSSIQCPVFFSTTTVTSEATSFICCANASPKDFSPPIAKIGMFNLVCDSSAKSFAACWNETKYAQPALILPGRAYAAVYAFRSASGIERVLSAAKLFQKCSKYVRSRPCTKASGIGPLNRKCQIAGLL